MRTTRTRNLRIAVLAATLMVPAVVMVSYAPTIYRIFCSVTGYGGTTQRTNGVVHSTAAAAKPTVKRKIRILFDSSVAPGLDWEFRPVQRSVEVTVGQPVKIYYYARNRSDKPVVARASFNVTPYKAAPYFFKIQCFCFTEERLNPGQSARMPVVLYVDDQFLKDPNTQDVNEITLFYTFFKVHGAKAKQLSAARDLKAGSKQLDTKLGKRGKAIFDNDALRR